MSNITKGSLITALRSLIASDGYLVQKDESKALSEMEGWLESHPVRNDLAYMTTDKVQAYSKEIIRSLQKIEVNESNQDMLKEHLASIAQESIRVRQYIIHNLHKLKVPKKVYSILVDRVMDVSTYKP